MRGLFGTMFAASSSDSLTMNGPNAVARWFGDDIGSMSNAGRRVTPDMSMRFSAVYACVNLLAKTVASLPLRMYSTRVDANGKWTSKEAPAHPLNDLLEYQPNKWQTAWDFRAAMQLNLMLRGNAYAEILDGPRGAVDRLEVIHPDRVQVEKLDNGTLRYRVDDLRGKTRILLQDEILHLRSPIAPGGLVGISPISYARETIGLALAAEEHGSRMFSNGARPSGIVTVPAEMSDPAFERFSQQWKDQYVGIGNSMKTPILENGAKFEPISLTAEDAQFLSSRQFQIEEIARWFDVPLVMLHHMTKTSSWGSGIEQIMLAFVRNNLRPWLNCWTQAIRRDLITVPGLYEARFDVEELQRGDSKAQAEFFSKLVMNGILVRNEARDALGYNSLPGLDEPLTPNSNAVDRSQSSNRSAQTNEDDDDE